MSVPVTTPTLTMQDFFSTTLSSSIIAGDTVLPLNAVPTGTEGFLVIDGDNAIREIVYYTSKGASSVTCPSAAAGRGQGGTTAASHSSGATVKMNVVSQYWTEIQNGHALGLLSVTNAKLAADISPVKFANPYKFYAYRTAAFTVANGTFGKIAFDTDLFDTGSNFDSTTNNRFVAPVAGFYQFNASACFNLAAGSVGIWALYKNNAEVLRGAAFTQGATATGASGSIGGMLQLAATDYIELFCYGAGGAGIAGAAYTYFSGYLVSTT